MGNSPGKEAVPAPQPAQPPAKQPRVEAPPEFLDGDKKLAKAAEVQQFERDKKRGESCVHLRDAPRAHLHKKRTRSPTPRPLVFLQTAGNARTIGGKSRGAWRSCAPFLKRRTGRSTL